MLTIPANLGYRRTDLAIGEWFHCYTRTIDRSRVFSDRKIAERFLETLYIANQSSAMPVISDLRQTRSHDEMFSLERQSPLVAIGAYSVMPTHYHLLVQPLIDGGLSTFMHKIGTSFTRYYNERHERVGNLFIKPFRSRHIAHDAYFMHIPNYIHLNAAELFEPGWKKAHVDDMQQLEKYLGSYAYSSLPDYTRRIRPQRRILNNEALLLFQENIPPLHRCLSEAAEYFTFLELDM